MSLPAISAKAFYVGCQGSGVPQWADKANLEINPGAGEEFERNVKDLFRLEPALVGRLKEILK